MLRLSKKTDYGLIALQYLANEAPSGVASARAIAVRYDIPVELLAKVLQHLARMGFVAAHKGAHGGYHLALPAETISLADIVEAVEGPIALATCLDGDDCAAHYDCRVRPHWPLVNETLRGALAAIPLTRLAQEAEPKVPA